MSRMKTHHLVAVVFLSATTLVAGCASDVSDLQSFVNTEKAKKPGPIPPLPQIKPAPSFVYQAQEMRSPFVPDTELQEPASGAANASTSGIHPDPNRNHEYLEQFSLDSLRMVGTIQFQGQQYGLVKDADGAVHRVQVGNYLGQNNGEITNITESEIRLTEIIPDGLGGWMERQAALGLVE